MYLFQNTPQRPEVPAHRLLTGGLARRYPASPPLQHPVLIHTWPANSAYESGARPQTFLSLAAQLTGDEEPPSRTRHAKSIPGEARVAAGVRLAYVGKSQRPVGGERDPVGRVIIHHPLTQMFSIIIRAVIILRLPSDKILINQPILISIRYHATDDTYFDDLLCRVEC